MPEATPEEVDRFWAIRKGLNGLKDPEEKQLFLDVTTALVAAVGVGRKAGRGIAFEPLWSDPPGS